ncbi:hypothetical protein [Acutalibacter sp.]|uniref:hypothetical protein n=1 Tax=Acutalibacter sp. TaxID=1918636 RepID=UPI00216BDEFD|nr:hypothetical protein [Acutalibacter sp.]
MFMVYTQSRKEGETGEGPGFSGNFPGSPRRGIPKFPIDIRADLGDNEDGSDSQGLWGRKIQEEVDIREKA